MVRSALIALVLALAPAVGAMAEIGNLPALFRVVDVAVNDQLNVRDAPSARGNLLGVLEPGAFAQVTRLHAEGRWGRVTGFGPEAWVSMRYLARAPNQAHRGLPPLRACYGAEPFWSLDLTTDTLTFRTPEEVLSVDPPAIPQAANPIDRFALVTTTDHGSLQGVIRVETCSDGMSETVAPYAIDLIHGGDGLLSGCCVPAS